MAKAKGEHIWVWLDDPAFGPLQLSTLRNIALALGKHLEVRVA